MRRTQTLSAGGVPGPPRSSGTPPLVVSPHPQRLWLGLLLSRGITPAYRSASRHMVPSPMISFVSYYQLSSVDYLLYCTAITIGSSGASRVREMSLLTGRGDQGMRNWGPVRKRDNAGRPVERFAVLGACLIRGISTIYDSGGQHSQRKRVYGGDNGVSRKTLTKIRLSRRNLTNIT
jgi:hypothetical protein